MKDLPIYEIGIDLNEEDTSVEFNSLVADPAHEISFQTFSQQKKFQFNDEEQVGLTEHIFLSMFLIVL